MSDLVVIAYQHPETAIRARHRLEATRRQGLAGLEDLVVVVRSADGEVKVDQANDLAGPNALSGAFWGMLVGLLVFAPWLGVAIKVATGGLATQFRDIGLDDRFVAKVARVIGPGSSALFMLLTEAPAVRLFDELQNFGGRMVRTSLAKTDEIILREAFR